MRTEMHFILNGERQVCIREAFVKFTSAQMKEYILLKHPEAVFTTDETPVK